MWSQVHFLKVKSACMPKLSPFLLITGHNINLTNVMLVLKKVRNFHGILKAMKVPDEVVLKGKEEDIVGEVSALWLETKQSWTELKNILEENNEMESAELADLMEQYICEGITALCFSGSSVTTHC